jgi:hypothetical protein
MESMNRQQFASYLWLFSVLLVGAATMTWLVLIITAVHLTG